MSENIVSRKFLTTREMVLIAMFSAVIAVCSWISVPTTIPFTLQTFGVFSTMNILGGKKGFFAILVYILLGAVGMPVFSGFSAGISALMSYSGGYIWGFLFLALVYWFAEKFSGRKLIVQVISLIIGMMVCYLCGTLWFMYVTKSTFLYGLSACVVPYVLFDALKLILALFVSERVKKYVRI
ncbi:MAG: biotin transporter BioY [Prevotella sp.]|nr:biotin transporter BioY [Alistipes senegalensis]MCM1358607.1 biotin transporter BioY [Prevotella sp.]MCM1473825.1 biotin transporter BioY [Muribaculaceae bacterium]